MGSLVLSLYLWHFDEKLDEHSECKLVSRVKSHKFEMQTLQTHEHHIEK